MIAATSAIPADFDAVAYINEPRWHKVALGLDRTRDLMARLGNPQDRLRFVHVAGTNGKGSTCAYLASVLQAAGYRVGLFTSPYLITFEERIRVDGRNISADELTAITWEVRQVAEAMPEHPTEFELMTAVAFVHFARQACDIVVAEVGLGGRLDSTNIIETVEASVITRIGLDHTSVLGDTEAAIAGEKAGIIKPGVPVVSWPQESEAMAVIQRVAGDQGCELFVPAMDELQLSPVDWSSQPPQRPFIYRGADYRTQLLGSYQPSNAAVALETLRVLADRGWNIAPAALASGIANTYWEGRFQVVATKPTFVIDGGHNPQGAAVLAESLADVFPGRKPVLLMGILADKDHCGMLQTVLGNAAGCVAVTPPNPRALSAANLAAEIAEVAPGVPVEVGESFEDGVRRAHEMAGEDGLIVAFGSLYSIGSVLDALHAYRS